MSSAHVSMAARSTAIQASNTTATKRSRRRWFTSAAIVEVGIRDSPNESRIPNPESRYYGPSYFFGAGMMAS
jgi:hypothetical protein